MVFIIVCQVLKSLSAMSTHILRASSTRAGISAIRLGAPLANGIPHRMAAYAYIMEGKISETFSFNPRSKASKV